MKQSIQQRPSEEEYYTIANFIRSPKYDAHIHYHIFDDLFVHKAQKANMSLIAINTNFNYPPIEIQFQISQILHQRYPQSFNFIGTFDATAFASKTFVEDTVRHIKKSMAAGARGIKIWKNIGMALKNEAGQYIMADDPVFAPIFAFLEKENIPLLAHLGEPRDCWLPIEHMTLHTNQQYFSKNPEFHMYLHPEAPSYEQHIKTRDHLLERYPDLIFVGAHLGSMEWNFEEVARRLDRFPNFYVDLSAQFEHIYDQTIQDRNYVIDFFKTYQDRILYGSDIVVSLNNRRAWVNILCKFFPQIYLNLLFRIKCQRIKKHWLFLATDKAIGTGRKSPKHIVGLKLPKQTVDRIFYGNIRRVYHHDTI